MDQVITLQFGQFSNYVGCHLWNIQNGVLNANSHSIDDIKISNYFQTNLYHGKEIICPRCLIFDFSDSLGSMSPQGFQYSQNKTEGYIKELGELYDNTITVAREAKVEKSTFSRSLEDIQQIPADIPLSQRVNYIVIKKTQKLNNLKSQRNQLISNIQNFRDSQNSAIEISKFQSELKELEKEILNFECDLDRYKANFCSDTQSDNIIDNFIKLESSVNYWTDFNQSQWHPRSFSLLKNTSDEPFDLFSLYKPSSGDLEIYLDKIRLFAEACNRVDGIQSLVDVESNFGNLAATILSEIEDEYHKSTRVVYPIFNTGVITSAKTDFERNTILSANRLLNFANIQSHSSLVIPISASTEFENLSITQASKFHLSAPLASTLDTLLFETLKKSSFSSVYRQLILSISNNVLLASSAFPLKLDSRFNRNMKIFDSDDHLFKNKSSTDLIALGEQPAVNPIAEYIAFRIDLPENLWDSGLDKALDYFPSIRFVSKNGNAHIPVSYPQFFDRNVNSKGFYAPGSVRELVESIPMYAHLQNTQKIAPFFSNLGNSASLERTRRVHKLSFLQTDDILDAQNTLLSLYEDYRGN